MFDNVTEYSLLRDFYGELLTPKQKQVFELYHDENLSLSEIASEFGISRQAVHENLKKGEQLLKKYESKLGLIQKFEHTQRSIHQIDNEIRMLLQKYSDNDVLVEELNRVKVIIDMLED